MQKNKKKINFTIDARSPSRIIKDDNSENKLIVKYGNSYVKENKDYLDNNYPALVEDYLFFKITGEKFDEEYLRIRGQHYSQFQYYENDLIQQQLETKNNKIKIKQRNKTKTLKQSNFFDNKLCSLFQDRNLRITVKSNEASLTNQEKLEKLINLTHELSQLVTFKKSQQ